MSIGRDNFNKLDKWVSSKSPIDINLFTETSELKTKGSSLDSHFKYITKSNNIRGLLSRYKFLNNKLTSDEKSIIFGDVILSLDDISKIMIDKLNDNLYSYPEKEHTSCGGEYNNNYDDAGYYTPIAIKDIIKFYEAFDEDKLNSILEHETIDNYEIDTNGGRWYFDRGIEIYAFNYFLHYKKVDIKIIDNSRYGFYKVVYEDIDLPDDEEFNTICVVLKTLKYKNTIEFYNTKLNDIIKEFKDIKYLKDQIQSIKELRIEDIDARIRDNKIDILLV